MSVTETLPLFDAPVQPTWQPSTGRLTCGRDPNAGAASCWHWWEGCPKAEKRGCYVHWIKTREASA